MVRVTLHQNRGLRLHPDVLALRVLDVQNIDLMILADFCRNCLGDWWTEAAQAEGLELGKEDGRERVYGMPYAQWKAEHQKAATDEQMAAFKARMAAKGKG